MFQYDLTSTPLAADPSRGRIPSEPELVAILVSMLLRHNRAPSELKAAPLVLQSSDHEAVARIIEGTLEPFARDLGSGKSLRTRLRWLTGLAVMLD